MLPHPATAPHAIGAVVCAVRRHGADLDLRYTISGERDALVLPAPVPPGRADDLWRTTCLELFVSDAGSGYREFNFAPSGQWAAYRFTGPRTGMAALPMPESPAIVVRGEVGATLLSVRLPGVGIGALRLGITAVIEERDGARSYWALRHGGDRPDFHDPDCFVCELPPAG